MRSKYAALIALIAAAALIAAGILLRQNESVLKKAAAVCLECIGLG